MRYPGSLLALGGALLAAAPAWAQAAAPESSFHLSLPLLLVFAVVGLGWFLLLRKPKRPAAPPPAPAPPSAKTAEQKADVFISYKRDERAEVARIADKLAALRLNVWFDAELRSGAAFDREIDRHVRTARCVLVCWSPGAVASDWVRGEATIGRQRGVLAAVLLKDCDLPAPFNLIHADDLRAGPQGGDWLKALERIGALVGRPGLAGYAALESGADAQAIARWLAENRNDPLFDEAAARLKALS